MISFEAKIVSQLVEFYVETLEDAEKCYEAFFEGKGCPLCELPWEHEDCFHFLGTSGEVSHTWEKFDSETPPHYFPIGS